jgi:hypothetical protein
MRRKRRKLTYRLSNPRRAERLARYLNKRLAAEKHNGVHWFDCVDTNEIFEGEPGMHVLMQISSLPREDVLRRLKIRVSSVELKHMGLLLYNKEPERVPLPKVVRWPPRKAKKNFARLERKALREALMRVISALQNEQISPIRKTAIETVERASARA